MINKIGLIWNDLEKKGNRSNLCRLILSYVELKLFATYDCENRNVGILIKYPNFTKPNLSSLEKMSAIKINKYKDIIKDNYFCMEIKLENRKHQDIFTVLCDDLIFYLENKGEDATIYHTVNKLTDWQELFDKKKINGLSIQAQQGLFGELFFLLKTLKLFKHEYALNSWVGVFREPHDFQWETKAVEVKATSGIRNNSITIHNERQLDESLLDSLYLYHLILEKSNENGMTLNQLINDIRQILKEDNVNVHLFDNCLYHSGYFEEHSHLYDKTCYKIRSENFYAVLGDFPRIKEKDLRDGVGGIQYSIVISDDTDYLVTEQEVLNAITI